MSLFVASINSGSNGNCYYVGNHNEAVLIDAGISCREIVKRMSRMQLNIEKVKGLFISHEHSDHIKGVEVLSKKYNIPVYVTGLTLAASGLRLREDLLCTFDTESSFVLGGLTVKAFKKYHDAADPYSFNIIGNAVTVGVYTDIGHACKNMVRHFKECHAVFLETNYDDEMLENGFYPPHLKQRIKSDRGHLSNAQGLELFANHKATHLSHIFLSHLSKENNRPELVVSLFKKNAGNTKVILASRYEESGLFEITGMENNESFLSSDTACTTTVTGFGRQISMF